MTNNNLKKMEEFMNEWTNDMLDFRLRLRNMEKDIKDGELVLTKEVLQSVNQKFSNKRLWTDEQVEEILQDESKHAFAEKKTREYRSYKFRMDLKGLALKLWESSEEEAKKILEKEAQKKIEKLISQIESKVGTITDATDLSIIRGELNGIIFGTEGKAKVSTVLAGGYNIQCLHHRVLVKSLKK